MAKGVASTRPVPKLGKAPLSERHPGNLGKWLMDYCNEHDVRGAPRDVLHGFVNHMDVHGWCWPGHEALAAHHRGRVTKSALHVVGRAIRDVLVPKGVLGVFTPQERARVPLEWSGKDAEEGAPVGAVFGNVTLYLLLPIATPEALAFHAKARRLLGQTLPERVASTPWAIRGERSALLPAKAILAMIQARELGADDEVRALKMTTAVRVRDVPEFSAALPPPRLYYLHPAATEGSTEQQLAQDVGRTLFEPARPVWDETATQSTLASLPLVASAFASLAPRKATD